MKKVMGTVGAVVIVGLIYAGSSWYVGSKAEDAIADAVHQSNERIATLLGSGPAGDRFNIEIRRYDRGVFSSTAEYVIHTVDALGEPVEYVISDHLGHGPFPVTALRAGRLSPMLAYSQADMVVTPSVQRWFDPQQAPTPLHISTQVGFGGAGTSAWTFAPFETNHEGKQVSFSGGELHIEFTDRFNNSVATGHVQALVIADDANGEKVEVRDITLHSTTVMQARDQVDQRSSVGITSLTIAGEPQTEAVRVDDLDIELHSVQKGSIIDATLRYDLAGIALDDAQLGQLTFNGAVKQLDVRALASLQDAYAAISQRRGPDAEPGFELTPDEQAELVQHMLPLLATGPSITLDPLTWTNGGGQSDASASIVLRRPSASENLNADDLLRELVDRATLSLSVSRPMVVQLFEQVGTGQDANPGQAGQMGGLLFDQYAELLARTGLMTRQGDVLSLSIDVVPATNQVVLNGETMTMEHFMMLALGLLLLQ